jgi:hypothetical protein
MSSFSAGATDYPEIRTTRTRGTVATPTAVQTGDDLLRQNIFGHTGTTSSNGANIIVEATENWTPTNKGVSYTIGTEANGGTGIVERFKIDGSGDITLGNFKFDGTQTVGAGQDNYVLTYDNATGKISLEASAGGGLANVVDDTTPQLGGSLDVNGQKIVSVAGGNIDIEPNGTGNVLLGNFTFDADQTVGAGQDNYVLTYDNATGLISLEAAAGGGGGLQPPSPAEQYVIPYMNATGTDAEYDSNFFFNPSTNKFRVGSGSGDYFEMQRATGRLEIYTASSRRIRMETSAVSGGGYINSNTGSIWIQASSAGSYQMWLDRTNKRIGIYTSTPTATLNVKGEGTGSGTSSLKIEDSGAASLFEVRDDGVVIAANLPTSSAGLPTGALWNNSGVINIV